jgi:hypothetical protein
MTGPFVPVGILNLIRAVVGIPHHRFNLFVKCSSPRARGAPPRGLHRSAEWRGDKLSDGGHGADPNRQVRSDAPEHACRGGALFQTLPTPSMCGQACTGGKPRAVRVCATGKSRGRCVAVQRNRPHIAVRLSGDSPPKSRTTRSSSRICDR